MRRGRALFGLGLAAALLAPQPLTPPAACAAAADRAALVIDTGPRTERYCVTLDSEAVSGIHLIELAGAQHGLDYHLGYGGQAVCMLAGVGPTEGDCFADDPLFWGYFRGDSQGRWSWSEVGAGSTVIEAGDVEGWSWGSGDGGADHDAPPVTPVAAVCGAGETDPSPSPGPRPAQAVPEKPSTPSPSPVPTPAAEREPPRPRRPERRAGAAVRLRVPPREKASFTVRAPIRKAPARLADAGGGPPVAGLAGLAGVVVVALLGTKLGRRRRGP